jgi:hypothetical protein
VLNALPEYLPRLEAPDPYGKSASRLTDTHFVDAMA